MSQLVIIDTGCANLSSVQFALRRLGVNPCISRDSKDIQNADKLLLPGVGTAEFAMANLTALKLVDVIKNITQPTLGICLGMQLLTKHSSESKHGTTTTLGLIDAHTDKMMAKGLPLPHMGWNKVAQIADNLLFDGIDDNAYFYFVHSYAVAVGKTTLGVCEYAEPFSAVICQDNFYGVQFHPEKSGKVGSRLLQNFVEKIK